MSLKTVVSSKICDLNSLIFNKIQDTSTSQQTVPNWQKIPTPATNSLELMYLRTALGSPRLFFQMQGDNFCLFRSVKDPTRK